MRTSIPKLMIAIAVMAIVIRVYMRNVVEPERRYHREWTAYREAMTRHVSARAELRQRRSREHQRVFLSLQKKLARRDLASYWKAEPEPQQPRAVRDSSQAASFLQPRPLETTH